MSETEAELVSSVQTHADAVEHLAKQIERYRQGGLVAPAALDLFGLIQAVLSNVPDVVREDVDAALEDFAEEMDAADVGEPVPDDLDTVSLSGMKLAALQRSFASLFHALAAGKEHWKSLPPPLHGVFEELSCAWATLASVFRHELGNKDELVDSLLHGVGVTLADIVAYLNQDPRQVQVPTWTDGLGAEPEPEAELESEAEPATPGDAA